MNKHYNDKGEIGILVSGGFGAGWSTWHWVISHKDKNKGKDFLTMDKTLVEMCLGKATKKEVEKYLESQGIDTYTDGWNDCRVEYLPPNTAFRIHEYDGSESLWTINDLRENTGD